MKRTFTLFCILCLVLSLVACSNSNNQGDAKKKIGILQYAPHASLDDCYNGIITALKDKGFDENSATIEFVNGQGESETNRMAAENFVSNQFDIIIAIATPSAISAYAAAKDANIPVVFSAVSDPLSAGLVESLDKPNTGATGTMDNLNYQKQLELIRAFQPDAKRIGILYTTSEANSITQLKEYEKIASDYGFEIVSQGITDASEVATGITALVSQNIDCVNNLTDNNVVNNFSIVTATTEPLGIPCYGSEIQQVAEYGCVASESLDYVDLGYATGEIATEILNGGDVKNISVKVMTSTFPVYSSNNMEKYQLELPSNYSDALDTNK